MGWSTSSPSPRTGSPVPPPTHRRLTWSDGGLRGLALSGVGTGDAELEVELEYGVPGAVWVPDLPSHPPSGRRQRPSGAACLRRPAHRRGLDGRRIGLSAADLRRRTDLPRLRSIGSGRRQPTAAPAGWRGPPGSRGSPTCSPGTTWQALEGLPRRTRRTGRRAPPGARASRKARGRADGVRSGSSGASAGRCGAEGRRWPGRRARRSSPRRCAGRPRRAAPDGRCRRPDGE